MNDNCYQLQKLHQPHITEKAANSFGEVDRNYRKQSLYDKVQFYIMIRKDIRQYHFLEQ